MTQYFKYILSVITFVGLLSCGSGNVPIPSKISMRVGPGYTSASVGTILVAKNSDVKVGIIASKLETSTLLKTFQVSNVLDASTTTNSIYTETLSGNDVNTFNKDYTFKTRDQVGIEKWIFSVTNSDGITNQVYIILDVEDI